MSLQSFCDIVENLLRGIGEFGIETMSFMYVIHMGNGGCNGQLAEIILLFEHSRHTISRPRQFHS